VVELGGFSPEAQRHMLANLLDAEDVDDDLFRLVERTCEGNPLYIEEMARYLLYQEQVEVTDGTAKLVGEVEDLGPGCCRPDSTPSIRRRRARCNSPR
jgi:hypothetical protein